MTCMQGPHPWTSLWCLNIHHRRDHTNQPSTRSLRVHRCVLYVVSFSIQHWHRSISRSANFHPLTVKVEFPTQHAGLHVLPECQWQHRGHLKVKSAIPRNGVMSVTHDSEAVPVRSKCVKWVWFTWSNSSTSDWPPLRYATSVRKLKMQERFILHVGSHVLLSYRAARPQ